MMSPTKRSAAPAFVAILVAGCGARGALEVDAAETEAGTATTDCTGAPIDPMPACTPGARFAGTLCGDDGDPCRLVADEEVPRTQDFGAFALDTSCRPTLLTRDALATRGEGAQGTWTFEATPFVNPTGEAVGFNGTKLGFDGVGSAYALVPDPNTNAPRFDLFRKGTGAWVALPPFPPEATQASFDVDTKGALHAFASLGARGAFGGISDCAPGVASAPCGWTLGAHVDGGESPVTALGPDGTTHVLVEMPDPTSDNLEVLWRTSDGRAELVFSAAHENGDEAQSSMQLGVTADDPEPRGSPHALFVTTDVVSNRASLWYGMRQGPGFWGSRVIDDVPLGGRDCGVQRNGETCTKKSGAIVALGVVTTACDGIGLVYANVAIAETDAYSNCNSSGCSTRVLGTTYDGKLMMTFVDAHQAVHTITLANTGDIGSGSAILDARGVLHVATNPSYADAGAGARYYAFSR